MSAEHNKTAVRRLFEEGLNQGRDSVIEELIAPNYVNHDFPASAAGPEGFKQVLGMFRAAFPDIRVTLEDVLGEDGRVATRGYFSGTHQGDFQGIPATGKPIKVSYIDIWRVQDGKLVENWVKMDLMGLMQQLGAIPTP
jgi:steroid delta-isomerase-like uncharacterized protein